MWSPTLPGLETCLWLAPGLAALVLSAGAISGWLKARHGLRTGDTRKIFHFTIFSAAAFLSHRLGFEAVNLLGGIVWLYVLLVLGLGEGCALYEALARESDAPRRSLYIVLPFVSTAVGGILSTALFGRFSTVGFAVSGFADAIAEPIGIRFGRHHYCAPSLGVGVRSERSLEGSAAVFIAAFMASAIVLWFEAAEPFPTLQGVLGTAVAIAVVGTLVEACSQHGLDNLTLQVAASGAACAFQ